MIIKALENKQPYELEIPEAIKVNNKIYNTLGLIQLNNGTFFMFQNENQLTYFDLTMIQNIVKNARMKIQKPTGIEIFFMNYLKNSIQEKLNTKQIQTDELNQALNLINTYIQYNKQLLNDMSQLDNKDKIVVDNKEALIDYFNDVMSQNKYFLKNQIEEPKKIEQPVEQISQPVNNIPEYDEQTITAVLNSQNPNLDITKFVSHYFEHLTISQINIILNNYHLNDELTEKLKQKKDTIKVFNALEKAENNKEENNNTNQAAKVTSKRKSFSLFSKKDGKESAFVDTLLLSFTVGTFCGIYAMYFILTIMS